MDEYGPRRIGVVTRIVGCHQQPPIFRGTRRLRLFMAVVWMKFYRVGHLRRRIVLQDAVTAGSVFRGHLQRFQVRSPAGHVKEQRGVIATIDGIYDEANTTRRRRQRDPDVLVVTRLAVGIGHGESDRRGGGRDREAGIEGFRDNLSKMSAWLFLRPQSGSTEERYDDGG